MAYSLSPKENYLLTLNHKPNEYTPGPGDAAVMGFAGPAIEMERGANGAGVDAFGVTWVAPWSAAGGALPTPGEFLLTDITEWKKTINIRGPEEYGWEEFGAVDIAGINRDVIGLDAFSLNCIYERLATLMGFEEALIALIEEPEASFELLSAITDWKIKVMEYYARYYKPDTYIFFDDVATEQRLFMAPETYRSLIKPLHTKLCNAAKEFGMIPIQHTCGKADSLVQDMIDEGAAGWHAVQATNDIEDIISKHGDEFVIIGGYNSNGPPGQPTATEDEIRAEVRRCMDSYAKHGKGYVFSGMIVNSVGRDNSNNETIADEFSKIRSQG
ncbi:MAG: hypothetical protein FWG30_00065 [Eubacteriaceae bacterium]|nr:hypothetical protein [Eubacteriaceae bacterium]